MNRSEKYRRFADFSSFVSLANSDFELSLRPGGHLSLSNSGRRGEIKEFNLGLLELNETISDIIESHGAFVGHQNYDEKEWRDLGSEYFRNRVASSLITVQTKPFFTALAKTIKWANGQEPSSYRDGEIDLSLQALQTTKEALNLCINASSPTTNVQNAALRVNFISLENEDSYANLLSKSLKTKPFAILTGASGTGKTRLAESLAKSYACGDTSRYAVVAVGADWTDNRHVLGFVNHLREIDGLSSYQSTPVLDLLLHADAEREVPHFLVLDEMNLSHVERYFADFLSAMERPDGRLNLHNSGADDDAKLPRYQGDTGGVPRSLHFPKNLFVIGTVNVDETTYMFSPKVLDRANVIEFRMSDTDLDHFLQGDGTYPETQAATEEQASAFLAAAKDKELDPLPIMATASDQLKKIFALMEKARFEFGYRATGEVIRYLKICRAHAVDQTAWDGAGWSQDFDHQILQKLLPRLHGGMGRMGPLLTGLGHFCHGTPLPPQARIDSLESLDPSTARFPKSFAKISSMAEVLREEQFVSFIC
jgi:MoxR-like ATPase